MREFIRRIQFVSAFPALNDFIDRHFGTAAFNKFIKLICTPFRYVFGFLCMLYRKFKSEKGNGKICVVAIAKNESDYIAEWAAFHKTVGFDHIFLYDNDSTDGMQDKLKGFVDSGFVTVKKIPGQGQQFNAYNDAVRLHRDEYEWMAFIDCDEFLMPEAKGQPIASILESFIKKDNAIGGVAVNWCVYGSSGFAKKPDGLLIENFVWRAKTNGGRGNECIKTIARSMSIQYFQHPHYPVYKSGYYPVNTQMKLVPEWSSSLKDSYILLRINHYFTKSKEQWIKRRSLGRAPLGANHKRSLEEFYLHDNNDVEDKHGVEYAAEVKELLLAMLAKEQADYREDYQLISHSDLFDAAWYLKQNPDVEKHKMDRARSFCEVDHSLCFVI